MATVVRIDDPNDERDYQYIDTYYDESWAAKIWWSYAGTRNFR